MSEAGPLPSEVTRVTFYEDRAEVARRARATVPAGATWVALGGIGIAVDDSSLVARARGGGARVLASRIHRAMKQIPAAGAEEIERIEADLRAARTRRAAAELALERAGGDERRALALLESWAAGVSRAPRGGEDQAARWRLVHESLTGALATALDEASARRGEAQLARLDEARAGLRLAEGRALQPRYQASALLQVESATPGIVELEITYRIPLALWRPEHVARLEPTTKEMTIRTLATVWQRTGEEWRDVPCRFSTARPARAASPPLLSDDVVRLTKKADKTVTVEGRDMMIAATTPEGGVRKVDDMPGVEDGGEPLWFESTRRVTIPSDGKPFRVEVAEVKIPCEVDLIAYPELGGAAHLRARATLPGGRPLLAGPVRVGRAASMVGRSKIGFVGQGEPFELGFGVDDGVRVRRRVDERRETTAVIGTQRILRSVRVYVSSLGDRPRRVRVVERVPVSEIEDVSVKITAAEGATLDEKDGFVRFDVDLPAGATREVVLEYRIEAAARVQLTI